MCDGTWNQRIAAFGCDDVDEMASSTMTQRKVSAERNKSEKRLRFTPEEIVRAIAGVEAAGLQVYGVEITSTGSIRISTGPRAEASAHEAKRQSLDETGPVKKPTQSS